MGIGAPEVEVRPIETREREDNPQDYWIVVNQDGDVRGLMIASKGDKEPEDVLTDYDPEMEAGEEFHCFRVDTLQEYHDIAKSVKDAVLASTPQLSTDPPGTGTPIVKVKDDKFVAGERQVKAYTDKGEKKKPLQGKKLK